MNKKQGFDWNRKWSPSNEPTGEDIEKYFEEGTGIPVSFHWEDRLGKTVTEKSKAKKGVLIPKKFLKKEVAVEVIKQKGEILEGSKQISWGKFSDKELISNSQDFSNLTRQDSDNNNEKPFPYLPVFGTVGIVALLGIIAYKVTKNKRR